MHHFSTWSIATTVRAPDHQIDAFIRHHVRMGVERIYLFFDDPAHVAFDREIAPGVVQAFICDDGYWRNWPEIAPYSGHIGNRPENIETRQSMNMLLARAVMPSEWLLHIDIDEMVHARRPLGAVLGGMAENVFSVVLKPLEAIYPQRVCLGGELDTRFFKRFSHDEAALARFYPEEVLRMCFGGMLGHVVGKSLVRKTPVIARMSVHQPVPADGTFTCNVETSQADLLHFEGQSFELFREKSFARRAKEFYRHLTPRARARADYLAAKIDDGGEKGLLEAYQTLYVMSPELLEQAVDAGIAVRIDWQSPSSDDALLPVHNPVNAHSSRPSTWQGHVLRTPKGHYMVAKGRKKEIKIEKVNSIVRDGSHSRLVELSESANEAVLFMRTPTEQLFIRVDRHGDLAVTTVPSNASRFSIYRIREKEMEWIALRHEGRYLSASADAGVSCRARTAANRERFLVRHVVPQL